MSATTIERIEVLRDLLTAVAAREMHRTEACPQTYPSPQDRTKALKASVACTKEIGGLLTSYRTLTPVFKAWDDVELLAAVSLVGSLFTSRMSFRDSGDFEALCSFPAEAVQLFDSFRNGRLREYACLTWGGRHWTIELLQPDALMGMVVGD